MLEILIDVINLPIRAYNYFVKIWNKCILESTPRPAIIYEIDMIREMYQEMSPEERREFHAKFSKAWNGSTGSSKQVAEVCRKLGSIGIGKVF